MYNSARNENLETQDIDSISTTEETFSTTTSQPSGSENANQRITLMVLKLMEENNAAMSGLKNNYTEMQKSLESQISELQKTVNRQSQVIEEQKSKIVDLEKKHDAGKDEVKNLADRVSSQIEATKKEVDSCKSSQSELIKCFSPLYRAYKAADKNHFYTTNEAEYNQSHTTYGFKLDGHEGYVADKKAFEDLAKKHGSTSRLFKP